MLSLGHKLAPRYGRLGMPRHAINGHHPPSLLTGFILPMCPLRLWVSYDIHDIIHSRSTNKAGATNMYYVNSRGLDKVTYTKYPAGQKKLTK